MIGFEGERLDCEAAVVLAAGGMWLAGLGRSAHNCENIEAYRGSRICAGFCKEERT